MTDPVTVVGAPFLDFTFEGLPRLPLEGEELLARSLHVGLGGTGIQALGCARLGLTVTLVAPLGTDPPSRFVRSLLEEEGIRVTPPPEEGSGVSVTSLLSTEAGVAMASVVNGREPTAEEVSVAAESGGVVASLGRCHLAPSGNRLYVVTGSLEVERYVEALPRFPHGARALIVNEREAGVLTGRTDPAEAAIELGGHVEVAVVTMGPGGAIAACGGEIARGAAPEVEARDATGAGDLFVAAYVWADLKGLTLPDRLRWACSYAGLSVEALTPAAGALRLEEFLDEAGARCLALPSLGDRLAGSGIEEMKPRGIDREV